MELFIFSKTKNPTDDQLKSLRKTIGDSLSKNSSTWVQLDRSFDIGNNVKLPLFTHKEEHYQNEPFYFRFRNRSIVLQFENGEDENSKSMIIGMLTYYLVYNLHNIVEKIEIK